MMAMNAMCLKPTPAARALVHRAAAECDVELYRRIFDACERRNNWKAGLYILSPSVLERATDERVLELFRMTLEHSSAGEDYFESAVGVLEWRSLRVVHLFVQAVVVPLALNAQFMFTVHRVALESRWPHLYDELVRSNLFYPPCLDSLILKGPQAIAHIGSVRACEALCTYGFALVDECLLFCAESEIVSWLLQQGLRLEEAFKAGLPHSLKVWHALADVVGYEALCEALESDADILARGLRTIHTCTYTALDVVGLLRDMCCLVPDAAISQASDELLCALYTFSYTNELDPDAQYRPEWFLWHPRTHKYFRDPVLRKCVLAALWVLRPLLRPLREEILCFAMN